MERVIEDALIIQTMALEYFKAMQGGDDEFTLDEAFEAALATWGTEWDGDPEPRTLDRGIEAVHQDLVYWGEE